MYEKATGEKIVEPDALEPGADGKRVEIYVAVQDFCGELNMFKQIAEKVGPNLTNDTWVDAVNNFGTIELVTTQALVVERRQVRRRRRLPAAVVRLQPRRARATGSPSPITSTPSKF